MISSWLFYERINLDYWPIKYLDRLINAFGLATSRPISSMILSGTSKGWNQDHGWYVDQGSLWPSLLSPPSVDYDRPINLWQRVCHIKKNIEGFNLKEEMHGLGLRGGNNWKVQAQLKIQENVALQVIKLYNKLPQNVTVLSVKRFGSRRLLPGRYFRTRRTSSESDFPSPFFFLLYVHSLMFYYLWRGLPKNWSTTNSGN